MINGWYGTFCILLIIFVTTQGSLIVNLPLVVPINH